MKIIVDELPYYNDPCIFESFCHASLTKDCPRNWPQEKVMNIYGARECELLIEAQSVPTNFS